MQKLWDILGKDYLIYFGIYWAKTIGYILGYIGKNYGIYWAKTMRPIGYLGDKPWDIYTKNYGYIMGYIRQNLGIYLAKTKGHIEYKLWDILWDIIGNICRIDWAKTMGYIG